MTWYKDITIDSMGFAKQSFNDLATSPIMLNLLRGLAPTQVKFSYSPMDHTPTSLTSTLQHHDMPTIIEHMMVDMVTILVYENPEFIEDYFKEYVGKKLQTTAMDQLTQSLLGMDSGSGDTGTILPVSNLKNENFTFWWDYDDGEVVIFAESNSIDHEISRVPFDDDEERILAEAEAETLIKKLYRNEIRIGEFIQSDDSTVSSESLTDKLIAWMNTDDGSMRVKLVPNSNGSGAHFQTSSTWVTATAGNGVVKTGTTAT